MPAEFQRNTAPPLRHECDDIPTVLMPALDRAFTKVLEKAVGERGAACPPLPVTNRGPSGGAPCDLEMKLKRAWVGHSGWPLMRGNGSTRGREENWSVLDHFMVTNAPCCENITSLLAKCLILSKATPAGFSALERRSNPKNIISAAARTAASFVLVMSRVPRSANRWSGVMGNFRSTLSPKVLRAPLSVRDIQYESEMGFGTPKALCSIETMFRYCLNDLYFSRFDRCAMYLHINVVEAGTGHSPSLLQNAK